MMKGNVIVAEALLKPLRNRAYQMVEYGPEFEG